jgi:hypothetical protein
MRCHRDAESQASIGHVSVAVKPPAQELGTPHRSIGRLKSSNAPLARYPLGTSRPLIRPQLARYPAYRRVTGANIQTWSARLALEIQRQAPIRIRGPRGNPFPAPLLRDPRPLGRPASATVRFSTALGLFMVRLSRRGMRRMRRLKRASRTWWRAIDRWASVGIQLTPIAFPLPTCLRLACLARGALELGPPGGLKFPILCSFLTLAA